MSRTRGFLALAVLAAAMSGCSVSTSGRPTGSVDAAGGAPRMARAELVSAANAICARRTRALARLAKPHGAAASRRFFAGVAEIERAEFLALAALRPPRTQEQHYLKLLAASLALVRVSDGFHAAVVARDAHARRRALADADRLSESYDREAKALGFACRQTA